MKLWIDFWPRMSFPGRKGTLLSAPSFCRHAHCFECPSLHSRLFHSSRAVRSPSTAWRCGMTGTFPRSLCLVVHSLRMWFKPLGMRAFASRIMCRFLSPGSVQRSRCLLVPASCPADDVIALVCAAQGQVLGAVQLVDTATASSVAFLFGSNRHTALTLADSPWRSAQDGFFTACACTYRISLSSLSALLLEAVLLCLSCLSRCWPWL